MLRYTYPIDTLSPLRRWLSTHLHKKKTERGNELLRVAHTLIVSALAMVKTRIVLLGIGNWRVNDMRVREQQQQRNDINIKQACIAFIVHR